MKMQETNSKRHTQFLLFFLSIVIGYGMRTNMSVGIIAMMEKTPPTPQVTTYPTWTKKNLILSSFFWGYVIPQIGAGQLVKKFGPKWFLAVTMAINSLFSLLIPIMAAIFGEYGVIACRLMQGLNQGFLFPSVHTMLAKWTPLEERSRIASFVYTGGPLGTVISMPVTGLISNSDLGWPWVFYLYGAIGLVWVLLWSWFGTDSPSKHPSISRDEEDYINRYLEKDERIIRTPWRRIFTSLPVWAILISHCGQNWGFWTLLTEIPSYMNDILGYDIQEDSLLSALPYLALWILNFVFSMLADCLIVKKLLSIATTRKVFNSIGLIIPALALVWLGFVKSSEKSLALGLLVIAVGFNAAIYSGFNVNHIDLSPNHSGILMGITNSLSNIFSILAPLAIQAMGKDEKDPVLWQFVFCLSAGIYVTADVFFLVFASGEVQPWNHIEEEKD